MATPNKGQRERMAARNERIRQLHAEGLTWAEIGRSIGLEVSLVGSRARKLGLKANFRPPLSDLTADDLRQRPVREIASERGVTARAVYYRAAGL